MAGEDERQTAERTGVVKTVLFADIADSSRILVEGGDASAHTMVRGCLEAMIASATGHGGEVVDEKGDEVLCVFPTPTEASAAAADMQVRIATLSGEHPEFPQISLRIGFEHGPLLQSEEGVFGTTIYSAARLVALAKAGQILSTKETIALIGPTTPETRFFARQALRGQPQEREISELLWDLGNSTAWVPRSSRSEASRIERIEITHKGECYRVDADAPRLDLGRNDTCDLPVNHEAVSRLHARVSWSSGRAYVEDLSTNGTVVESDSERWVPLHHERTRLTGSGTLRLGTLTSGDERSGP